MATRDDVLGKTVYASDGEEVGSVSAVFDDRDTGELEWLAIGRSLLGRKSVLVPVVAADIRETGVFLSLASSKVDDAPEISSESIGQEEERRLYSHYGIEYSQRQSSSGLPEGTTEEGRGQETRRESATRSRSGGGGGGHTKRSSRTDQTREELYQEARELGVEGRSKMSKEQLKRAVGRRRGRSESTREKANPVEVQKFLEGVGYPTGKRKLVEEAESQGASRRVRATLERLPDERRFGSPAEVSKAIGRQS
jgi:hypothetical protein